MWTLVLLFVASFIPYTASLVGDHFDNHLIEAIYGAVVIIMIAYSFFRTPQANLSLMASWLVSLEISAAALEYYTDNTYYMHNLWHDIATLAFVFYSLYWDIRLAKKEVTQ